MSSNESYTLSVSTGCCRFGTKDRSEDILSAMDAEMYSSKQRYYQNRTTDRRNRSAAARTPEQN